MLSQLSDPPIKGYYHICCLNNYAEIVKDQIDALINSDLLKSCESINVVILAKDKNVEIPCINKENIKIRFISDNINLYERATLNIMREDALEDSKNNKFYNIWYIHSKGISDYRQAPVMQASVNGWRKAMEAFIIWKWRKVVSVLQSGYDCYGINFRHRPRTHYSGNFWWSTTKHISKLNKIPDNCSYLDPEMWLCSSAGKFYTIFDTHTDHYKDTFSCINVLNNSVDRWNYLQDIRLPFEKIIVKDYDMSNHIKLIQHFNQSKNRYTMIMEDTIKSNLPDNIIADLYKLSHSITIKHKDWEIICFGCEYFNNKQVPNNIKFEHIKTLDKLENAGKLYCYAISKIGSEKVLKLQPNDWNVIHKNIKILYTEPSLFVAQ